MPPLEKTETRVFHLRHVSSVDLSGTLEKILGPQLIRVSFGPTANTLVIRAGEEALDTVESVIAEIDQPEVVFISENQSALPQSVMVRIFWLSNGQTNADAQPAEEFLPDSVIKALAIVGIETPFVVLQSNTSTSLHENVVSSFEVHRLPAIVFSDHLRFNAEGEVTVAGGGQLSLRLKAAIKHWGSDDGSHVSGSMIVPLDHFVVLGTASYASLTPNKSDDDTYSSSRFAFVVQTVEAESFAPEK